MDFQKVKFQVIFCIFTFSILVSCQNGKISSDQSAFEGSVQHPEWSYNLTIYEVNLRQYSQEGTFKAFEEHLPRLKDMGIGILWFMPIHPIGELNRKGSFGSYYAVKDYLAVNPEHGTMEDFKHLVKKSHELGMYVILDWVANHTAWDNQLTTDHPEWYTKDENGNFTPPVPDWSDVIDLNYDNAELRTYMIDALKFWVEEADIDGYRCDVAEMVPMDFWFKAREELDKIKPVFMLAEADSPELHEAFDMTYSWEMFNIINAIGEGEKTVQSIHDYFEVLTRYYPQDAFKMYFTSNHDENSWKGTVFERLGQGVEAFAVLIATLNGMPLVYSGQEAGLDKRLQFFEKDVIEWRDHKLADLYGNLFNLKTTNKALWHGAKGGELISIENSKSKEVFSFIREKDEDKIFVVLNLSASELEVELKGDQLVGEFTNIFSNEGITFSENAAMQLEPWGYRVFVK